jgi:hypothetical protein
MSVRDAYAQSLAAQTAAMTPGHVGGRPGFVDEHEAFGGEIRLVAEPVFSPLQNVGAFLLGSVRGLFLRVTRCRMKKRWIVPKPKNRPRVARLRRISSMVASF